MEQTYETKQIIEKYKELYLECLKYPRITLGENGVYKDPQGYAKGGFVEMFCCMSSK